MTSKKADQRSAVAPVRATSGAGFAFEDLIGAWLLLKMLSGEAVPGMQNGLGVRLQFQTAALGWRLDDILVTCRDGSRLAISCKGNVQVTATSLSSEFVSAAWAQLNPTGSDPAIQSEDRLALVTRGQVPAFDAAWTEVKKASTGSDSVLALSRIRGAAAQLKIFDSVKDGIRPSLASVTDDDVLKLVRQILVIPTDFDLAASNMEVQAISACRQLLRSGDVQKAEVLWLSLVDQARAARLGGGTIELIGLLRTLSSEFELKEHPDYRSSLEVLQLLSREYLERIEAKLPSGHELSRTDEASELEKLLRENSLVVMHGESGVGKSALAKAVLQEKFPDSLKFWFGHAELNVLLNELERRKAGLQHPLTETLSAAAHKSRFLVIDAAERIPDPNVTKVQQALAALQPDGSANAAADWKILVIGQTDAWAEGRLQRLLRVRQPSLLEIGLASKDEVKDALRAVPELQWLSQEDDAIEPLRNLRVLAWVVQGASHITVGGGSSLPAIVDAVWRYWTDNRLVLQGILMRLAEKEASFEPAIAISELPAPDLQALDVRPIQLPLRITKLSRVEFQHDLASDWARFQWLKSISGDAKQWSRLAQNPLWTSSLRLLGQFLLRERVGQQAAWDGALTSLESAEDGGLGTDMLLDALCLDPLAESMLNARTELLFADHGALLNRLLRRFLHIATAPSTSAPIPNPDPVLSLYIEAKYRMPIYRRWRAVVRFLDAHRDRVAKLMLVTVADLCERWLSTTPVELAKGVLTPLRHELSQLALATAREVQVERGKRTIFFGEGVERTIFSAALLGASDSPEEVSQWALEMAERRPWRADVTGRIADYNEEQGRIREERLRTDPEYRDKQERLREAVFVPSARELPPWPLGPQARVERYFRETCLQTMALNPMMTVRPAIAAELLNAVIIEDSPEEDYNGRGLRPYLGLEFDVQSYPTAFWKSRYYHFLQISPDLALGALINLVEFCTDRWQGIGTFRHEQLQDVPQTHITLQDGSLKAFRGNYSVFDWAQENSNDSGQLHSTLAALEKWLCALLEQNVDVTPYVTRILHEGTSVSFLGVLVNVGKFRRALFQGILRPLLAIQRFYLWDAASGRNARMRFDAGAWARQGEAVFNAARDWHGAAYRAKPLEEVVGDLVMQDTHMAGYLAEATHGWEIPEDRKGSLEARLLLARFDHRNYRDERTPDGRVVKRLEYPPELVQDVREFQAAVAPAQQTYFLPSQCQQFLSSGALLSHEDATRLAGFLAASTANEVPTDEESRNLARVAAASTLLARGGQWLKTNTAARSAAERVFSDSIDSIGDTVEILGDRRFRQRGNLAFLAQALIPKLLESKQDHELEFALLRILTSGDEAATSTILILVHRHRAELGEVWENLLKCALLWSALVALAPRPDEPKVLKDLWAKWLAWLRRRRPATSSPIRPEVEPLKVGRRVARLLRRRLTREYARDRYRNGWDPAKRRFDGLDTRFLLRSYDWLIGSPRAEEPVCANVR